MRRGTTAPYGTIAVWIGRGGWGATAPLSPVRARARAPLPHSGVRTLTIIIILGRKYNNNTWPKILAILMGSLLPEVPYNISLFYIH